MLRRSDRPLRVLDLCDSSHPCSSVANSASVTLKQPLQALPLSKTTLTNNTPSLPDNSDYWHMQGKHDEALRQLANDVYFSSLQVGPEHIETAGGYYYIATVFYLQRRIDCALAMCDKVVDIWLKHVSGLIDVTKVDASEELEPLGESQLMDGLQTLTKIVALREESMGPDHITTGEALYTVSLVYIYAKDNQRALQLMEKAYNIYYWELGPDSTRTQELAESIRLAGGVPQAPTGERPQQNVPHDLAEVIPTCAHAHAHKHTHTCIHACTHTHTHTHKHTHTNTHTNTHTHIHTHKLYRVFGV